MSTSPWPILLLRVFDEGHPFDAHLEEVLLTERYHGFLRRAAVVFTHDMADTLVRLHRGHLEKSSTGPDLDANRDGKFTADDAFEGMRDFELRHVLQADVHQDLLTRAIRGLLGGAIRGRGPHLAPSRLRSGCSSAPRPVARMSTRRWVG